MIDARLWLLDAAVELGVNIPGLAATNVGEILNRKPHGHSPGTLARTLAQLVEDGEITVHRGLDEAQLPTATSEAQLLDLLSGPPETTRPTFYRLSPRGGGAWEAWAKPQWSRYNVSCSRDRRMVIGAATAAVADELLGLHHDLHPDEMIVETSIRRRTLRNWQATYWKMLPAGHLIAFRTRPHPSSEHRPILHHKWARWVDLRGFYLKPADCGF